MRLQSMLSIGLLFLSLCQTSCSRGPAKKPISDKVPLTHVTGTVLVDGIPTQGVFVRYVPSTEIAETREQFLRGFKTVSGPKGKLSLSTYEAGDGLPAGEYSLTFEILEQRASGEFDQLGGQYSDRENPFKKIIVEPGKDLNLGEIDLKRPAKNDLTRT